MGDEQKVGMATVGSAVEDLVTWLKEELSTMAYGEVGLTFTVHGGRVTKHRKVLEVIEKI